MRTTVRLDDDVEAAVARLRREQGVSVSDAINQLVGAGLSATPRQAFRQRSARLGLRIDVADVVDALDLLDAPGSR